MRRRVIVRAVDLDEAVEVHGALANAVVFESGQRKLLKERLFLFEHHTDLPFGGAVDARHRPALVPAVEMHVLLLDALETSPLQSRLLRVADLGFNLALEIGRVRPAWQRDHAVVLQHLGVQRVELRIVDVGFEDAFFEVVESDRVRRAAELRERLFVQLAPDLSSMSSKRLCETSDGCCSAS